MKPAKEEQNAVFNGTQWSATHKFKRSPEPGQSRGSTVPLPSGASTLSNARSKIRAKKRQKRKQEDYGLLVEDFCAGDLRCHSI